MNTKGLISDLPDDNILTAMKQPQKINIIFAGTSDFAVFFLDMLHERENIRAVITRPDKPAGRRKIMQAPPVKVFADKNSLETLQPGNINSPDFIDKLKKIPHELIAVVSYGGILKKSVLELPPSGCINIHPSLLPKYRGPCPVERALMNGDKETGVCCILMDEGMDSGNIIEQKKIDILISDTKETLEKKLISAGLEVLIQSIEKIKSGSANPVPQKGTPVYAPFIKKEEGVIDWKKPAAEIHNLIRALYPSPGARSELKKSREKVIIWESSLPEQKFSAGKPGKIFEASGSVLVSCGKGAVIIKTVQPEGGKKQHISDFLRGRSAGAFEAPGARD